MDDRMTTAEAAQHFDVSERTIRRWIQTGKLVAERSNGQWAVRTDARPSECPSDREDDRTDDRLTEVLESEILNLKTQLQRADVEIAHLTERVEEKTDQIEHLREQLPRRDDTIESLTREINHLTQVVAMSQKNIATLTDQLSVMRDSEGGDFKLPPSESQLEGIRQRPWWRRLFGRKIANSPTS